MSKEEEVLIEQLFPCSNMNKEDRNFYLNLIINSKELTDSIYNYTSASPTKYDLVFLTLQNEGSIVRFNGAISNGEENKMYYGVILNKDDKYYIHSNFYRLFDLVFGSEKEYSSTDQFTFKKNKVERRTIYKNNKSFKAYVNLKSDEEMENYLRSKIGNTRKRR
jgi:serine/threonine-protein kinase RIO1